MKNMALNMVYCLLLLSCMISAQAQESKPSTSWPSINGPNGDATYYLADGLQPAIAQEHIQQVWDSTLQVAATALTRQQMPNGGCATPIIADGKMYIWWMGPDLSQPMTTTQRGRKIMAEFPIPKSRPHLYRALDWALFGREYIACIDVKTGTTLWVRCFNGNGPIYGDHKTSINNHTMVAAKGYVFAKGTDHHLYCLDAKTGTLIWRRPSFSEPGRRSQMNMAFKNYSRIVSSRSDNFYLQVAGDTLVDNHYGAAGYDIHTGEMLWKHVGKTTRYINAKAIKLNNQPYVLLPGYGHVSLVEPKSGKKLWTLEKSISDPRTSISVQGDLLFVNHGELKESDESHNGHVACYRINREKAELVWENQKVRYATGKNHNAFVREDVVFIDGGGIVQVVDLKDGRLIKTIDVFGKGNGNTSIAFRVNDYLYTGVDSQHLHYPLIAIDMKKQVKVGEFTLKYPGISYSSHMMPVFHGDSLYLRRNYGRISRYRFIQNPNANGIVLNKKVCVLAPGEETTLKAEVKGEAVDAVVFKMNGKQIARVAQAPYEVKVSSKKIGQHLIEAISMKSKKVIASNSIPMEVVDMELRLIALKKYLRVGEKRRIIPVVFRKGTDWPLPQRFQVVRFGELLDETYDNAHKEASLELQAKWRERCQIKVTGGSFDTIIGDGKRQPYRTWGTYTAEKPGEHLITASYQHGPVTLKANITMYVVPADAKLPQEIFHVSVPAATPLGKSVHVGVGLNRPIERGEDMKYKGFYKVLSGPGKQNSKYVGKVGLSGKCVLKLKIQHPGNDKYLPSNTIEREVIIYPSGKERKDQKLSFASIANQPLSTREIDLQATADASTPIAFRVLSGPATVDGSKLLLQGKPGIVTVVAENMGDGEYKRAMPVVREFKAGQ